MSKNKSYPEVDSGLLMGMLCLITIGILLWMFWTINDIRKNMTEISATVAEIEAVLDSPFKNIDDPEGLLNHLKNIHGRPMQKEYPEANFSDTTVPDEPEEIKINMKFTETLESNL